MSTILEEHAPISYFQKQLSKVLFPQTYNHLGPIAYMNRKQIAYINMK